MNRVKIAPSILAADFSRLGEDVARVKEAGADMIHVDVMDAHFVPNLTIGPVVVEGLRRATDMFLDCHLMITDPADYVEPFHRAGADAITFHIEVMGEPLELIDRIRSLGMQAGLSLNPSTPIENVLAFADKVDRILVMSVNPGFGGQKFIPEAVERVARLRRADDSLDISVDGGINSVTGPKVVEAGANILVAGTYIFGSADVRAAIESLRKGIG